MSISLYNFARLIRNAFSKSPGRKDEALRLFANMLSEDFRLTWGNWDWYKDAEFNAFLEKFGERNGLNTHRKFQLRELLKLTRNVAGDTAECGVFTGASSYLICQANFAASVAKNGEGEIVGKIPRKKHLLFDTFAGLSAPAKEDGGYWQKGDLCVGEEIARENLKEFLSAVEFYKGLIPSRFAEVSDRRFSFAHIDVDLYEPTRDSLAFFYDRANAGGIILCDDYGSAFCPGATKAFNDFMRDKPEEIIVLSGGGCFVQKSAV
ncbi:MAG: TylF/MycF family methyltransferase [Helicobacteraceae bacterium]|jgi:hypothetical protein|nr:TylF/MycF family methyltransferase [Helicobacteraceae bacterium]